MKGHLICEDSDNQDEETSSGNSNAFSEGYLTIDTSVLNDTSGLYSSLTDINGIDLFTDDYEAVVNAVERSESRDRNNLRGYVFSSEFNTQPERWRVTKFKLFRHEESVVVRSLPEGKERSSPSLATAAVLFAVIISTIILISVRLHHRKRKHAADIYTYN